MRYGSVDMFRGWLDFSLVQGFDSAFAKYGRDQIDSLGLPYDYGSIMHYPFNAFSKNGQPTLRALHPLNGKTPYKALSALDAEQTNKMYGCAAKKRKRRQTGKYIGVFFFPYLQLRISEKETDRDIFFLVYFDIIVFIDCANIPVRPL